MGQQCVSVSVCVIPQHIVCWNGGEEMKGLVGSNLKNAKRIGKSAVVGWVVCGGPEGEV